MKRPAAGTCDRITPYAGATPLARYVDCFAPQTTLTSVMNSGLHAFTSGSSPTASASAIRSRTAFPARSPPACMLVCPANMIVTPSPNAPLNPRRSAWLNPSPYASSITTDTMPQEMPSIERPARTRLRRRPVVASRTISVETCQKRVNPQLPKRQRPTPLWELGVEELGIDIAFILRTEGLQPAAAAQPCAPD